MSDEMILDEKRFIEVTLNSEKQRLDLAVHEKANDRDVKKNEIQRITWKLDKKTLKGAGFVSMDACKPGFEWLSWPPPDKAIFPSVSNGHDILTIEDAHTSTASTGFWFYKLRVRDENGTVYETSVLHDEEALLQALLRDADPCARMMLAKDPIIINR